MSAAAASSRPRPPRWFFAALAALGVLFLVLALRRADRNSLRGDEILTLTWHRESGDLGSIVLKGAPGQVSPAPLYYVAAVLADRARGALGYLGLTWSGYARLPSILFSISLGTVAILLLAHRMCRDETPSSPVAWFLLLCALAVYWFQPKVFAFAGTDRPYALWNGLWLLTLAWMLCRPESNIGLAVLLTVLAATATAACFQILAVGIAFAVVRRRDGRSWKDILKDGSAVFTGPALLGAYYALRSNPAGKDAEPDAMTNLAKFWLVTNLPAWLAAGPALALVFTRPKLRNFALPVISFTLLLIMIPLIYGIARIKGFSSPSRQYLWTMTGLPLALSVLALSWKDLNAGRPARILAVLLGSALVCGFSVATFLRPPARNDSRRLACLEADGALMHLLQRERPRQLAYPADLGEIEEKNVLLMAEWIGIRYHDRPSGAHQIEIRDRDGRLDAAASEHDPTLRLDWRFVSIPP